MYEAMHEAEQRFNHGLSDTESTPVELSYQSGLATSLRPKPFRRFQ